MSFREYLHEKAEESRHNETLAYLMFLAGAIFFVGGTLTTINLGGHARWFLLFPYYPEPSMGSVLGLTLIISGVSLIIFGIAAGLNYSRDRGWYMQELQKANSLEESMLEEKTKKLRVESKKID